MPITNRKPLSTQMLKQQTETLDVPSVPSTGEEGGIPEEIVTSQSQATITREDMATMVALLQAVHDLLIDVHKQLTDVTARFTQEGRPIVAAPETGGLPVEADDIINAHFEGRLLAPHIGESKESFVGRFPQLKDPDAWEAWRTLITTISATDSDFEWLSTALELAG